MLLAAGERQLALVDDLAVLHHEGDRLGVVDAHAGVRIQHYEIGKASGLHGSELIGFAEKRLDKPGLAAVFRRQLSR